IRQARLAEFLLHCERVVEPHTARRVARAATRAAAHALTPMSTTVVSQPLSQHLKRLEAESIGIIREVAAEFRNPVMLYSIGKDSSVMLHLALKAFYPSRPPFPLLHVDTTWKFREMIEFRDQTVKRLQLNLLVHVNEDGLRRNINPFDSGSALHTPVM